MNTLSPKDGDIQKHIQAQRCALQTMERFHSENLSSLTFKGDHIDGQFYMLVRSTHIKMLLSSFIHLLNFNSYSIVLALPSVCRSMCELAGEIKWVFEDPKTREKKIKVFTRIYNSGLHSDLNSNRGKWFNASELEHAKGRSYEHLAQKLFNKDAKQENISVSYSFLSGFGHGDPDKLAHLLRRDKQKTNEDIIINKEYSDRIILTTAVYATQAYSTMLDSLMHSFKLNDLQKTLHDLCKKALQQFEIQVTH